MRSVPIVVGLMLTGALAACNQSDCPELTQAKTFALQVITDQLSETTAADPLPTTAEAAWSPIADTATRVAIARRYGPVVTLRPPACALPGRDMTKHCDGALFICAVDGAARAGGFSARVAICHSDSGGWEVAAEAFQFPP